MKRSITLSGEVANGISPRAVALSQALALVVTWWLFETFSLLHAVTLVWAVGLSHYLLGFIYSWRSTRAVLSSAGTALGLFLLAAASVTLYVGDYSLALYFGLHHALNEAYISGRFSRQGLRQKPSLCCNSFLIHLLGYFLITHDGRLQGEPAFHIGLALVFTVLLLKFAHDVYRFRSGFIGSEVVLALLIPLDIWVYDIHLYHFVLYHFVFWMAYPVTRLRQTGSGELMRYGGFTLLSVAVFIALIPAGVRSVYGSSGPGATYYEVFVFLSFVHITLSFAISRANPAWINRMFAR